MFVLDQTTTSRHYAPSATLIPVPPPMMSRSSSSASASAGEDSGVIHELWSHPGHIASRQLPRLASSASGPTFTASAASRAQHYHWQFGEDEKIYVWLRHPPRCRASPPRTAPHPLTTCASSASHLARSHNTSAKRALSVTVDDSPGIIHPHQADTG